jgi:hypothetical protein
VGHDVDEMSEGRALWQCKVGSYPLVVYMEIYTQVLGRVTWQAGTVMLLARAQMAGLVGLKF